MPKRDDSSTSREIVPVSGVERGESAIATAILEFVSRIPDSDVPRAGKADAEETSRRIASSAANKAALTAGSLALPPGPLGWLTVLPELVAIWRIQGQMVSDIAAAYGKTARLGREQMLWCLFRHTAAQAFRDVAIRVGDRLVFRTAATSVLQRVAGRIGVSVSKRAVGKGISRWLPVVGALGVGAYAYYDTGQVAKTAMELFSGDFHTDDGDPDGSGNPIADTTRARPSARKAASKAGTQASTTKAGSTAAKGGAKATRSKAASKPGIAATAGGRRKAASEAGIAPATGGVGADRVGDPKPKASARKAVKRSAAKKPAQRKPTKTATKKTVRKRIRTT
ncbi:hypothetical protein L2Y94_02145 [Luteibacter aegosomatis]|uniref:hypothetical protein n=1 Tax=Luteibacter aegosomatis TaxID=2911537 RepID=UPI001FFAD152|nr:hypothetical protein [Luteibacter aegosomatis]UPG86188.1 hypothetical protein L2Y94_02145 [Luteibacter aegosomatis]